MRLLPFTLFPQMMTFTSSDWPSQREETPFSRGSIGHGYHMSTMADDFQCIAESMSRFGLLDILLNFLRHMESEQWGNLVVIGCLTRLFACLTGDIICPSSRFWRHFATAFFVYVCFARNVGNETRPLRSTPRNSQNTNFGVLLLRRE